MLGLASHWVCLSMGPRCSIQRSQKMVLVCNFPDGLRRYLGVCLNVDWTRMVLLLNQTTVFMKRTLARYSSFFLTCLLLFGFTTMALAQDAPDGTWNGAISIQGQQLNINVHFATADDALSAKIDIPQQGATGIPLQNVSYEAPKVHFELQAGPGLATFDGELQEDGTISGTFKQAGFEGTFSLEQAKEEG